MISRGQATKEIERDIDACAPLAVWPREAEATPPGSGHRGHGVWIDTRLEHESAARGWVVLLVRRLERKGVTTMEVFGAPVQVTCSLETGALSPNDHDAARFLYERPWLPRAVLDELPVLRSRAMRAAAQADRGSAARRVLARAEPDAMVPYDELFPADWDLLVTHAGATYYAVDYHCPNPRCPCTNVVVSIHGVDDEPARFLGDARVEITPRDLRVEPGSPEVGDIVRKLCAEHGDELRHRYEEARRAVLAFARREDTLVAPAGGRVPRNAPCPCGSGKKYKRCCIDRAVATG